MDPNDRLKRLRYRASHRGTREADILIGAFVDAHSAGWDDAAVAWAEAMLEEQDVDIIAWAIGTAEPPDRFQGPMLDALRKLDYVPVTR